MKLFIKIGEIKHLNRTLKYEKFYFGKARTYINIENKTNIVGQGDNKESSFIANGAKVQTINSYGIVKSYDGKFDAKILIDVAADIPIYCLSLIDTELDCIKTDTGYKLSEEYLALMKQHFPKADSAILIKNTSKFLNKFNSQYLCQCNKINYINTLDEGVDEEYIKLIASPQGSINCKYEIMKIQVKYDYGNTSFYTINRGNSYKILFVKDKYFADEKEFRIVLPNKSIKDRGKEYLVRGTKKYMKLYSFLSLENNDLIKYEEINQWQNLT